MPELPDILDAWNLQEPRLLEDLTPAGSPSRVHFRKALEAQGVPYVLECLPVARQAMRLRQARILAAIHPRCPKASQWLPTKDGDYGVAADGWFWQLRPWHPSLPLPRETYANDAWRGGCAARFLAELRQAQPTLDKDFPFYICSYIQRFLDRVRLQHPLLYQDLLPIWEELQPLRKAETSLPLCFCHGDFHPLNILWAKQDIQAVIDWEFCGVKPELYDCANLLGCLGMDEPANFTGPMASRFLQDAATLLAPASRYWLPDYIAALRFAWMREWLVRNDNAMIIQELDFIWLVLDNRDRLRMDNDKEKAKS